MRSFGIRGWRLRVSLDCGFLLGRASLFSVRLTSGFAWSIIGVFSFVFMLFLWFKSRMNIIMLVNGVIFHSFLSSLIDF